MITTNNENDPYALRVANIGQSFVEISFPSGMPDPAVEYYVNKMIVVVDNNEDKKKLRIIDYSKQWRIATEDDNAEYVGRKDVEKYPGLSTVILVK